MTQAPEPPSPDDLPSVDEVIHQVRETSWHEPGPPPVHATPPAPPRVAPPEPRPVYAPRPPPLAPQPRPASPAPPASHVQASSHVPAHAPAHAPAHGAAAAHVPAHTEETLGPIDVPAWSAGLLGA